MDTPTRGLRAPIESDIIVTMDAPDTGEADGLPAVPKTTQDLASARALVIRAYAIALASGRSDWRRMSIAVLKNRLLDITDRQFAEAKWGASTTREFVELLDDLLALDFTTQPPTAVLDDEIEVDDALPVVASESARRGGGLRIRRDLWDAVMDFSSGNVYVWDGRTAVACQPGETQGDPESVLPTIASEELVTWRRQYAEGLLPGAPDEPARISVERWRDSVESSQLLPTHLRNRWYRTLTHHVRARLEEWFAQRAEEQPKDLITSAGPPGRTNETEELRALVTRAIEHMSRPELEMLSLPVSVIAALLK